jgi:PKD repeat protein
LTSPVHPLHAVGRRRTRRATSLLAFVAVLATAGIASTGARAHADGVPGQQQSDTIISPPSSEVADGSSGPGIFSNARDLPPICPSSGPTAASGYQCSRSSYASKINITSATNDGQHIVISFAAVDAAQVDGQRVTQEELIDGDVATQYGAIRRSDFSGYQYEPQILNPNAHDGPRNHDAVLCDVGSTCQLELSVPAEGIAATHLRWMRLSYFSNNSAGNSYGFEELYFPVPPSPGVTPPTTSATYHATGVAPLQYAFDGSGSRPSMGTSISGYTWSFGDGVSDVGATPTHTYAHPGSYSATLTVTDADGGRSATTLSVVASAPDLSAAIAVTAPDGSPLTGGASAKGKTVRARVTLSAASSAQQHLTGVTAVPAVSVSPNGKLVRQDSSAGPPSGGYDLAPGASQSYDVVYTITGVGRVTLSVDATGDEAGSTQEATAQTTAQLGQPLQVDISFSKDGADLAGSPLGANSFRLADDDKGELPQDVTAKMTVTNVSGSEQDAVQAQQPDLSVADPASNHDPFPMTVVPPPGKPFPRDIGVLAAGASTSVTFGLHVTGNQDFRVSELVLSSDPALGDTEKSLGAGDLHALPTALLLVDLKPAPSVPSHIVTGRLLQLDGTVTNLSNTQTLDLDAVLARITGNGGGQTSAEQATPTADGYLAPVTGKVKSGDKAHFHVLVQTKANGGTRATVTLAPTGKVVATDGTEKALTSPQVRLTDGTSPLVLHLDDSDPAPESAPDASTAAYIFTASALEGLRDWCANGFHAVADLADVGRIGDGVVAAGGIVADNLQTDYEIVSVIKAEIALHVFWSALTPAQRDAFAEQVAIDTDATAESFKQFHDAIKSGTIAYFSTFQNAFQRGDAAGAWQSLGHGIGSGVPEALTLLAPEVVLGKVARGLGWGVKAAGAIKDTTVARAISLAGKIKESEIVVAGGKALKGVAAGDNLLASGARVLKNSFGMAQRDIDILSTLAKRRNLLVAVRQRNPITTAWLKTREFLLKPELLKIKNVDEMDVEFLGYRGKGGAIGRGDYGTVVFKEPDPIGEVYARLRAKGASPEVRKAALKRYYQREQEWVDYRHLYEGYDSKGIVDLGFDKAAQGAGSKGRDLRKFHLEELKSSSGRKYYRVKISDKRGVLKYVTGDIDIVAILNADGTLPSAAVRALIYDDLLAAIGMQHGETFSWIKDGELFSKTKAKLLADHLPGGEQLAVFGPDGLCRAAFFDPKLTVFNTATHEAYATFVGAYTTPLQKLTRYTTLKLAGIK